MQDKCFVYSTNLLQGQPICPSRLIRLALSGTNEKVGSKIKIE